MEGKNIEIGKDFFKKVVIAMIVAVISKEIYFCFYDNLKAGAFIFGITFAISIFLTSVKNKFLQLIPYAIISIYFLILFVKNIISIFA